MPDKGQSSLLYWSAEFERVSIARQESLGTSPTESSKYSLGHILCFTEVLRTEAFLEVEDSACVYVKGFEVGK